MLGLKHSLLPSPANRQATHAWWTERKFWLGIVCSAFFLYLACRNVHWAELGIALRAVDGGYLLLALVVCLLRLLAGGLRWRALVMSLGPLTVREAFAYLNIGHMANNLLPLRAGEIVRTVLLGEKKGFSKSAVLATIVLDRLLDILVLVVFTLLLMLVMPISPLVKQSAVVFAAVGCLAAVGLWWAAGRGAATEAPGVQSSSGLKRPVRFGRIKGIGLMQKLLQFGRSFASGLSAVRSPGQAGAALGYSTLGWGLSVGFTWLVLRACNLELPWTTALMVVVVVNFGAAIPSAPGFIGVMHFLAVMALEPWRVEQSAALGFALVYHAQTFLLTVGLGAVYVVLERKSLSELSSQLEKARLGVMTHREGASQS